MPAPLDGEKLNRFDEMATSPEINHSYVQSPVPPSVADMPSCLPDFASLPPIQYTVQLSTANVKWAGTNKPVYIVLFGDLNQTSFIPLREDHDSDMQTSLRYSTPDNFNDATSSSHFPQGSVREFRFNATPVGNLVKICIRHDPCNDSSAAWKLDRVVVRNEELQRSWTFLASRWLSTDNGNHIELKPLAEVSAGRRASRRASRRLSTGKHNRNSHVAELPLGAERFASMRDRFGNDEALVVEQFISKGSEAGTRRVCFQLQKFTNNSCHVYLVGAIPALGSWRPERALRMTMHSAADGTWRGEWRLELEIDDDYDDIQYRYMIVNEKDPKENRRVEFPDRLRRFKLSAPDSLGRSTEGGRVHIRDSFGSNKFGLPSASSPPSLILRKSLSRRESLTTPRTEATVASVDRVIETFSSPGIDHLPQNLTGLLDDASEGPEEHDDQDPAADNASEEPAVHSESELSPKCEPISCESMPEAGNADEIPPEIVVESCVMGASIAETQDEAQGVVSPKLEIQREVEAARREWKQQLDVSDDQLFKSAQSLVRRKSELIILKKRNSGEESGGPVILPPSPQSYEKPSPVSSDDVLDDAPYEEDTTDITTISHSEIQKPIIEERDKLRAEVERFEREREEKQALYQHLRFAHDSVREDLREISGLMSVRLEEYEAQHAELVKLVMDGQEAYRSAQEELMAERDLLHDRWAGEFKARRKLFNTLQELRGNIRVFCRVRPLKKFILADGSEASCAADFPDSSVGENSRISVASKCFEFDQVFQPLSTQSGVYEETAGVVTCVLDGYNVCVFAYGQTGSGKTHTMNGPEDDRGVNYRALVDLFDIVEQRRDFQAIEISVSMMEIYNENLRDLIRDDDGLLPPKLEIRKDPNSASPTAVHVPNLTEIAVTSVDHVWEVMERGSMNRTQGKTNMNEHSSRSHLIFKVAVQCEDFASGVKTSGKLHLVDLAGSERVGRSNVSGDRLREAQNINKSLATLGNIFMALLSHSAHVPYRNSRLTYLLQDSLGGDSKTLMFVNVSADEADLSETVSSLQFAQRVAKVELGSARKHTEKTAEKKAIAALNSREMEVQELSSKIVGLRRELRKRDEAVDEVVKRARVLDMELNSMKSKLEEQGRREQVGRLGSAQELKELKASQEKWQAELRAAKQKVKVVTQSKDDEIGRLTALLKTKEKKIADMAREASRRERSTESSATRMPSTVSTPNLSTRRIERTSNPRLPRNATFSGRSRQVRFDGTARKTQESEQRQNVGREKMETASDSETEQPISRDDSALLVPGTPMSEAGARRVIDGKLRRSQTILTSSRPSRQNTRITGTLRPVYAFGKRIDTQESGPNQPARNVRLPRAPTSSLRPAQRVSQVTGGRSGHPPLSSIGRPPSAPRRAGTVVGISRQREKTEKK